MLAFCCLSLQKQALIQIPVMFRQAAGPKSSMDSNWNKNQSGKSFRNIYNFFLPSFSIYGFQWSFAIHCNDNALPIASYYVAIQGLWDFNQNKTNFSPMQGREGVVVFEAVLKLGIENLPRPAHYTFPLLRVLTLQIQIEIQIAKHQYQCK